MLSIRTIVHPTDFSDRSDYAYRLACSLARDYGARLVVIHVAVPPVTVYGDMILAPPAETQFKELKEKLLKFESTDPGLIVEHRLEEGDPVAEILAVAEECDCDLIVMGTHGRKGINRLLMGSVAEQIMRRSVCPVVTVKTPFVARAEEKDQMAQETAHAL